MVTFDIFKRVSKSFFLVKDMRMFVVDERLLICQTTPASTSITHFSSPTYRLFNFPSLPYPSLACVVMLRCVWNIPQQLQSPLLTASKWMSNLVSRVLRYLVEDSSRSQRPCLLLIQSIIPAALHLKTFPPLAQDLGQGEIKILP